MPLNFFFSISPFSRRDMCASEDAEVQTSILKVREEDQPKKKGCC